MNCYACPMFDPAQRFCRKWKRRVDNISECLNNPAGEIVGAVLKVEDDNAKHDISVERR